MIIFSFISVVSLIVFNNLAMFGIFIFITTLMDGVDGNIARMTGTVSKFGGFLDSTLDRLSEIIIFGGLVFCTSDFIIFTNMMIFEILMMLTLFSSLMISYMRSRVSVDLDMDLDVGLFARSERLFSITIILLFNSSIIFSYGMILISIGIIGTAIFRFLKYKSFYSE